MKIIQYVTILTGLFLLLSCDDDFLQRNPQTAITKEDFFNTPADLETYTNGFYGNLGASWEDLYSDNISINTGGNETDNLIRGGVTPGNVGGWNTWGELRRINYMLDNTSKTTGDAAVINHYIGVARFFRALFYYRMVKRYGDVPWYSHVMGTDDEAMLYKAKDPRAVVVDSVMNDLEFAATYVLPARTNKTMVTRWAALALLSRVALHEGTYRTYHDELGLKGTAPRFLERAVTASQKIMEEGGFEIHNTGNGAIDFRSLFSSNNLSANKEVIFLQKNSKEDGIANNTHVVLDWQWALSGSLANEFLMSDGTAFTSQAGYDKKTFTEVFRNRDPRMAETIMPPGFSNVPATNAPYIIKPSFGGYLQLKFYPRDPALRGGWGLNYTDLPIFRYAEVLLVHAEAKAELGTITQSDLDKTINLLRRRVKMPDLNLAAANASPDPYLAGRYPAVAGAGKGVILEIRRERRTEMACEGLRFDDLYRWKSGALLGQDSKGIYVPSLGGIDVTGDGVEDIAILKAVGDSPLAGLPADVKAKIVKYYLSDGSFYLSQATSGNIMFGRDKQQPRNFIESKYYYFPIPLEQTILNKNLKQSTGWE